MNTFIYDHVCTPRGKGKPDGRQVQPSARDVKQRILNVQAVEAARAMADDVLRAPADGDIGALLGVGFPACTGGWGVGAA